MCSPSLPTRSISASRWDIIQALRQELTQANNSPGAPQQQVSQSQVGGNVLLAPSYHPAGPSSGHTLPTLADLTQGNQAVHHQPSPYNTHPPPPNTGHSLPGLGHTLQQPQSMLSQEREREARELERHEIMGGQRLHEQPQRHPVQSHRGSIPIHQPVASKVPNTIHGPNGLLSGLSSGGISANANPVSSGPFSVGSQQQETTPRPAYLHQNPPPPPPQSMLGFAGPGPSPMPGHAVIGQQQPILNVSALKDNPKFAIL